MKTLLRNFFASMKWDEIYRTQYKSEDSSGKALTVKILDFLHYITVKPYI